MKVDPDVLSCATTLLHMAREAERTNGWEAGDLLRTTLRLLVVAGADGHGWSAEDLADEVHDLVQAVHTQKGDDGVRPGVFVGEGVSALH